MVEHNFNEGKISKCQICNSKKLLKIIELGNQPLANSLLEKNENVKNKFPICVVRCNECTLIQIDHIVNQSEVYHLDYPYLPGITKTVDDEQKEFSNFLIERLSLKSKDLVVDFGSNDGSLLKHLKNQKVKVIGVEPTNIAKIANKNGIETYQNFFNEIVVDEIIKKHGKAKVITSTNVFAHMSTLGDVMKGIVKLIDDDGYYCFENHYALEIIKNVQYDTFYHEHLRTYTLISLDKLFNYYDLSLIDAQIVSRYGGSIRCVVSKKKREKSLNLKNLIDLEKKLLIDNADSTFSDFTKKVERSKTDLVNLLKKLKNQKKKIIAKSCPARAVVLLNYCQITNSLIDYVAEQPSSLKLNKIIPGTELEIINDEILLTDQPDYILLLAWHLSRPIINKWKSKGLNSKFIVPLPEVKII
tara:strand:- start:15394 stop:16638 length:1245 start_codon:yes stop_codon:yes gene_type:complete